MEMKERLKRLREDNNLSQEEMAQQLMISRQAISRWETGATEPNIDTLKLISKKFNISINSLLGSPRQLICQCCGMPLNEDDYISRENDGSFNEDYCKWCYSDEKFVYENKQDLINYLISHMPNPENLNDDIRYQQYDTYLGMLKHWK